MKGTRLGTLAVASVTVIGLATCFPGAASAGDWGFSLGPFGTSFHYGRGHGHHGHGYFHIYAPPVYHGPYCHYDTYDYYPYHPGPVTYYHRGYNPVERRDVYEDGSRAPDGTVHSERTIEDRHRSYYSPGRNQAITPPQTSVREDYGPDYRRSEERTSWIGADGRPHSTTIDRVTTQDPYGNTRSDTRVDLKNRQVPPPRAEGGAVDLKPPGGEAKANIDVESPGPASK